MILIGFSVLVFVLFFIIAIVRTIRRVDKITFFDTFLVFLGALSVISGAVANSVANSALGGALDQPVVLGILGLGAASLILGLVLAIFEYRRPQRLKQSRGILLSSTGLLLLISLVFIPFMAAYIGVSVPPLEINAPEGLSSATASPDLARSLESQPNRLQLAFDSLLKVATQETGLDLDGILTALDSGNTIAQLVTNNDGSLQRVIDDATAILIEQIEISLAQGEISRIDAASAIAFARVGVTLVVNNDIETIITMVNNETGTDAPTRDPEASFFEFLTTTATLPIQIDARTTQTPALTVTSSVTPTNRATMTASRTPRPTSTATPTRVLYQSPTPTVTPTLPSPCVAVMSFNVNLRDAPRLDAELLSTIPFESVVNVYGRNEDSTWWFIEYEGEAGWVSGEFVRLTSSCELLPVRQTR